MYEQYKVKNVTAFGYFLKLSVKCGKWAEKLDKNPEDEKIAEKAVKDLECLEALGKVAFGDDKFKLEERKITNAKCIS